eukprot:7221953-Alexandrium_andersonii.AAC.1
MVHSDRPWRSRALERSWRSSHGTATDRHLASHQWTVRSQIRSRLALHPVAVGRGPCLLYTSDAADDM